MPIDIEPYVRYNYRINLFGDDFYLEVQAHKGNIDVLNELIYKRQQQVNKVIFELAAKTQTKVVASNDVHFVLESNADAHERLVCMNTKKELGDPSGMYYTKQEWLVPLWALWQTPFD